MLAIAAHAVTAICPHCSRQVRSSLEINAEVSSLQELLGRSSRLAQSGTSDDLVHFAIAASTARRELKRLQAELTGEHLDCFRGARSGPADAGAISPHQPGRAARSSVARPTPLDPSGDLTRRHRAVGAVRGAAPYWALLRSGRLPAPTGYQSPWYETL